MQTKIIERTPKIIQILVMFVDVGKRVRTRRKKLLKTTIELLLYASEV